MAYTAERENGRYVLHFPFDTGMNSRVKSIKGYHFDSWRKQWSVPATTLAAEKLEDFGFKVLGEPLRNGNFDWLENSGLRPYQREGVRKLADTFDLRGLLADEMGLGKTAQVIGALRSRSDGLPALVVCPAFLKEHWKREIARWYPDATVAVVSGKVKADSGIPGKRDFVIINYDILVSWEELIRDYGFRTAIFDECHRLKRSGTKWTKAGLAIGRSIRNVICVSGTQIESRPIEFFNVLRLLAPGQFSDYEDFGMRYCGPTKNRYSKYGFDFNGASNTRELYEKLGDIMIRRYKADVLDELPEKQRSVIAVEVDLKEYRRRWRKYVDSCNLDEFNSGRILTEIEGCKQAAVRAKMPAAIAWIGEYLESGCKLVVFGTHREILDMLEEAFPGCARVDGSVTGPKKQAEIDRFQNDPDCRLFIGNIRAAGVGITLTAASATLTLELAWTPGEHDQAEDRIHRIGQTADHVDAYYMVAKDTIEEEIFELLDQKRRDLAEVLDGRPVRATDLFHELYKKAKEAQTEAARPAKRQRDSQMPAMGM